MIVEPMVPRGLPRKEKQNLGILTFYKVRLFNWIINELSSHVDFYDF